MRGVPGWILAAALAACSSDMASSDGPSADAPVASAADAASRDAASGDGGTVVEDLDMNLADFASIPGLTMASGRSYSVANPLGHEAEALAAASSPTGGN